MGFLKIVKKEKPHKCFLPNVKFYGNGTVWICDTCGNRYEVMFGKWEFTCEHGFDDFSECAVCGH